MTARRRRKRPLSLLRSLSAFLCARSLSLSPVNEAPRRSRNCACHKKPLFVNLGRLADEKSACPDSTWPDADGSPSEIGRPDADPRAHRLDGERLSELRKLSEDLNASEGSLCVCVCAFVYLPISIRPNSLNGSPPCSEVPKKARIRPAPIDPGQRNCLARCAPLAERLERVRLSGPIRSDRIEPDRNGPTEIGLRSDRADQHQYAASCNASEGWQTQPNRRTDGRARRGAARSESKYPALDASGLSFGLPSGRSARANCSRRRRPHISRHQLH